MDLLSLASQHRAWLAMRQTTVAENIANSTTPGFKTRQVEPFENVIRTAGAQPQASISHKDHLTVGSAETFAKVEEVDDASSVTHSGNSVSIEDQMLVAGAIKREYSLNVSVSQAFRRMLMMSVKG